jgi:hypothetical protein
MRISGLATLPTLALALVSCRTATEIRIEVTTDASFDCAKVTTLIAVGTVDGVETKHPTATPLSCVDGRIGALVVVPSGDDNAEVAFRVVTARGKDPDTCGPGYGGCIVARRALRFLPHTSLFVSVPLRQSCLDKACLGDGKFSTCVDGQCVAATIADSSKCVGSGCGESALSPEGTGTDAGTGTDGGPALPSAWIPMASGASIGFKARTAARGVWTGKAMLVWGGAVDGSFADDGASYDPAADRWTPLPPLRIAARDGHSMVWTETEAIVWGGGGGAYKDGARYDPAQGLWRILPTSPLSARAYHTAVWTKKEMIIWGGDGTVQVADGAAYSPSTNTWRMIAAAPPTFQARSAHGAVWNGSKMIIYGGSGCGSYCSDAAAYDPDTNTWSAIAPPPAELSGVGARQYPASLATGPSLTLATFFGGSNGPNGLSTGATYDGDAWTVINGPGTAIVPDPDRYSAAAWWGGGRLWFWGGYSFRPPATVVTDGDGAFYDPATKIWTAIPAGGPSPRAAPVVVWTGTEAIIWGGETNDSLVVFDDGKRFRP